MIEEGQRVSVKHLGIEGRVDYIDRPNLWAHWMYPIQIILDRPYDDSGHRLYRANAKEIRPVNQTIDWRKIKKVRKEIKKFVKISLDLC